MATDNNDIFPEDITKMLEKMDKTIEENSSNLNADVQITVHTNSDNTDINNSFINLNKQIDDTLDTLDRRVDQHKGAFDIWKTFGVELDTESFGSDDANKDRTDKDAVYDQLALLAKVLNKNPKLLGTLTSLNGKNLKLVLGDSNERADYLNRANKLAYVEHGYIINKKEYDNNTDTIGFTGKNHNIITAPKSKNQNELDETLFHEYGHRILNKILDELGISHNVKGETVTQFINRLKIKNSSLTALDVQKKAREDFINAKIDGSTYVDMFHNPEKYITKPNKKIDTIIDLFTVINNDPLLLNKGSKKDYVNDFQEVFARSFANYVAGMANFYTDKRVNIEKNKYNTVNTKLYNSTMDQNFVKFLSLLNGENLIGKDYDNLLNFDTEYQILTGRNFKGKNSTEITKRLLNILNSSKGGDFFNLSYSKMDSLKTIKQILTDNHIELSKYNFSPTNIYKILSSLGYNSAYIEKDENGNQISSIKNIVHEILGVKTNQDIENLEKLSKLGKLIEKIKDIGDKIPGITINNIKDVYNILSEIGYDNLSKEEIEILRSSYDKLPTHVKTNLRGYKTSLDAAMSKIPTSDIENKNENYYEEKIKQDVTSFNSFADAIKSLSDTFKNNFESAIESSASYFKKAFESAIVSYGDVLARVGSGTNPFTNNTFTGGYNPSIIDKTESRVRTPFVTKDGRKLYSQNAINEYNQAQLRDSGAFVTDISVVPEVLQKSQPLLLTYDPSATFAYTQEKRESDFQDVLKTVTPEPGKHWQPNIYIPTNTATPNFDYLNTLMSYVPDEETRKKLAFGHEHVSNDYSYDYESILGTSESQYKLKRKNLNVKKFKADAKLDKFSIDDGFSSSYVDMVEDNLKYLKEVESSKINPSDTYEDRLLHVLNIGNLDKFAQNLSSGNGIMATLDEIKRVVPEALNPITKGVENTTEEDQAFARSVDRHSKSRRNRHNINRIREQYDEKYKADYIESIMPEFPEITAETTFNNTLEKLIDTFAEENTKSSYDAVTEMIAMAYSHGYDNTNKFKEQLERFNKIELLPDFPKEQIVLPDFPSEMESLPDFPEASLEEAIQDSLDSFKEITEENKKMADTMKDMGLEFQKFNNTDRTIITAGKPGFDAGGKGKTGDLSTESWIKYVKDEKSGEFHFQTDIPEDKRTLKEFMDVNESVVHMQKHLEDYYRFQHNNKTNMEVTPLEYLNYKYAERATNLQKRMTDTDSGFASTIYKVGGVEHTYEELMKSDEILRSKLAHFDELANQISHANDVDKETGQSVNPLTTYKWLRELSELEKDIKKRTANAIKEQQTIYKELSDISKEGEKIADDGIKQADKMLAGDSTYKSIFGKYKIPELSRSGKFKLTSDEYQKVLGIEDIIKTKKELLKDDTLKKDAREKLRNEIKNLNKQLDDYTTGQIADRAKAVSGIEDDYNSRVKPALTTLNKTFGNIFNTNADIDYENIRHGGISKIKEWSKYINLDNIFNINNVKRYASDLSKNISTMFTSGIRMFESAFSKISSIVGKVIKSVTIAITGAAATVTAAITGFIAGFTAMGKSIVSATDVYRKQTIALSGVYQSPTKTNRMINTVYDVTRSMPINYTQAVQTLSEMSAIPALQTILKSNDTQKADQLMTKMFKVITAMTTMRPDQRSSDAIFSLRNAFAGDLRSLQRRFDLPTANIMNVKGTMGLAAVKTDPMAMLDSLENYFDSFLDVGTINKISDTISIITEKIKGAIDLFKANIGNSGFYELVAKDFRKIRDVIVNFVTSADGKKMAKRLSDVFGNVYESVKNIAFKFKDIVAGIFNIDIKTLPDLFVKGLEFFAKSVNFIDKLISVKDITQYVKDLVKTVVDSKEIVLGYVDKIKEKLVDIVSPILKVVNVIIDATNDIVNVLKKTGLSDKGIIYLWLLGPSNVLNMIIGGLGAIKAALGLLVTTTGVLYNTFKGLYGLMKPTITFVLSGLKKGLVFLAPYLAYATAIAVSVDLIYHNWEKLKELGMNIFGSIALALEPVTNTLSDMWDMGDHLIAIGDSIIKSVFSVPNIKNAFVTITDLLADAIRLGLSKAAQYIPGLSFVTNMGDPNIAFENAKNDFYSHLQNNTFIPEEVKHSWDYHTSEMSKIWNRDRFGVWNRMSEGNFSDFTNLYKANQELYNPENIEWSGGYTGKLLNDIKDYTGNKINDIKSIPEKIGNFFKKLISSTDSNSDILNGSTTLLGGIKTGLDYIINNIKTSKSQTVGGRIFDQILKITSNPINSIGKLFTSYFTSSNPVLDFIDKINETEVKSYSAPYESPMWGKRLNSMALDVTRLQFQRGNIWSRNSKSNASEKMFKTDYGDFGSFGLQALNSKKLDNLKKIFELTSEFGKVNLNGIDALNIQNLPIQLGHAMKMTADIDNMIRDNIEASVMLMQEALGGAKLNYMKNDVMQFVMAKGRQFNSKLEQDMNDSIRLQYAVYFSTTDEFDQTMTELRKKYHDVNDMYSDIASGNVDFKDMSELGKQIITEFAKRYEAEREYLWNLERQRAYIEVTNQNINKMGLSELSGNWSNLMNSPYKKVRDNAGNRYMDIIKEGLEQDSMGSMIRKVRDIAINSFTDMKTAVINAVQETVKSTQQTIKNGLDKLISNGGTVKPIFNDIFETIKKNFFGVYTNQVSNELTKFLYGSSFDGNKQQDPMLKLDTDINDFHKDVLNKIDEVIASNNVKINEELKEWINKNQTFKNNNLIKGSVQHQEKMGSMLSAFESSGDNESTIIGITAEEFARNAKAVAENTNTVNECAKGYRMTLDTFAGGVAYAGKKLFDFDSSIVDANDYFRALANNKNFKTIAIDETKSLLSQLKIGDTLSWWNGKQGKEMKQHVGVYVGNGQLASDHIEDMKNRDWLKWRLDSGYGMPQVSRLATISRTGQNGLENTPISSLDNNVADIRNDIKRIANGGAQTVNSEINAPTINNVINNVTGSDGGFNLNSLFGGLFGGSSTTGGLNVSSGIADLGKRAGFGVIGSAIGKATGLSSLKSLFSSKSLNLSSIPLLSASSKGNKLTSLKLTGAGANSINSAIGMAGGLGVDISGVINEAIKPQTPLDGIWGTLFGTVENVESKFGGASVGSFLGNMMSGKGLVDSLGAVALKTFGEGTEGAKMIAGSNTLTKGLTGLTSTLLGKSAGQSVAKFLGKNFLGTTIGGALPIIGTVAKVLSGKGWFGGAKDRTAEGRARGDEFNSLRNSLIANRDNLARNYYMANSDTLDALKNYQFGEVAMWTSRRGHKLKGTKRTIMNTDATAFTNSMQGYWDLLQRATEEANNNQRKLDKLANTNNLEALRQTGAKESTRLASIADDLAKYEAAVSRYAGHDTGFTQTLFDGQSYTMTQLNDKVQDLIKELGDSKNAIAQNTEAIRQEKLATADAKLDYETALYGKYNPLISQQNEIQKLKNEWNSVMNDDGTIGYKENTKEWFNWSTRMLQATDNFEEATKQLEESAKQFRYDIANNWVSTLTQLRKGDGTYNATQVKNIADAYRKKVAVDSVGNSLESVMAGLNPSEMSYTEDVYGTKDVYGQKSVSAWDKASPYLKSALYAKSKLNTAVIPYQILGRLTPEERAKYGRYLTAPTGSNSRDVAQKMINDMQNQIVGYQQVKIGTEKYKIGERTYTGTSPIKEGAVTELYNTLKNYNKSVKNEADKIDISKYIDTKKETTATLYDLSTGKFNEANFNNDIKKALNTTEGKNSLMSLGITADTSFKELSDKYNAALKANPTTQISGYYTTQQYQNLLKKEGASLRASVGYGYGYNGKIYVSGSIADTATKKKNINTANENYLNAIQAAGYSKNSGVLTQKDGMYLFNAGGDVGNYQLFKFTKDQANQFTQIMFGKTIDAYMDYAKTTVTVDNMSLKNGIKLSDLFKLVDAGVMKYSELLGKNLEHQIAMANFENVVDDIKQNITSVMSHTTTSAMDTIKANLESIKIVNKNSKDFLDTGDYTGYDDFMDKAILPLVQNIGGGIQNVADIYEQAITSGFIKKSDATGAMAHMNDFMQKLEDAQYAYINALESGNSKDAKEAEKTLNELLSANSTYFKNLKNDYSNITKLVYQGNTRTSILGMISGDKDYSVANKALKAFNSKLGKNEMKNLIGLSGNFSNENIANMTGNDNIKSAVDNYEMFFYDQEARLLNRIESAQKNSEEYFAAEEEYYKLLYDYQKYQTEKADALKNSIGGLLGNIAGDDNYDIANAAASEFNNLLGEDALKDFIGINSFSNNTIAAMTGDKSIKNAKDNYEMNFNYQRDELIKTINSSVYKSKEWVEANDQLMTLLLDNARYLAEKAERMPDTIDRVLGSMSGYEDYTVANSALTEFNKALGKDALNKLVGGQNGLKEFTDENIAQWFGVSGEDPYETYYEYQKNSIMERIKKEKEGSEEWYEAELDLWNLMMENAKYLKDKAEKTTETIEQMLGRIEETAKMRVAEEAKSQKGDIVFFDLGASRDGTKFINSMLKAIKSNDPDAQKLVEEFKKKHIG